VFKINVFGYGDVNRITNFNDLDNSEKILILQIYLCLRRFSNIKSKKDKKKYRYQEQHKGVVHVKKSWFRKCSRSLTRVIRDIYIFMSPPLFFLHHTKPLPVVELVSVVIGGDNVQ